MSEVPAPILRDAVSAFMAETVEFEVGEDFRHWKCCTRRHQSAIRDRAGFCVLGSVKWVKGVVILVKLRWCYLIATANSDCVPVLAQLC